MKVEFMVKHVVIAVLSVFALGAHAQGTFKISGLDDIDPWGIGTLSQAEGALPSSLWKNSDPEDISILLTQTRVQSLSPSMRDLVRRTVLSSSLKPEGADDLLLKKRLDVIRDLGDPKVFADYVRQIPGIEGVIPGFELSIDNEFASGNLKSACSLVRASSQQSAYLLRSRAACYAFEGDYSSAQIALEFARDAGFQDVWFVKIVNFMSTEKQKDAPEARYDSGLTLAMSYGAGLLDDKTGLAGLAPELAVQFVKRADIPRKLRIQVADIAFTAGVIEVSAYRWLYRPDPLPAKPEVTDDTQPKTDTDTDTTIDAPLPINALDEAIAVVRNKEATDLDRALAFHRALSLAQFDLHRFQVVSEALAPWLNGINNPSIIQQFGDVFALAALSNENDALARRFASSLQTEGSPNFDPFMAAWLDAIRIVSGKDKSPESALVVSQKLAETADEATKASAARMIRSFLALDLPIDQAARKFLLIQTDDALEAGRALSGKDLLITKAAFQSGSMGEGMLRLAVSIGNSPEDIRMSDIEEAAELLMENNLEDEARDLLLEAVRFYRPKR